MQQKIHNEDKDQIDQLIEDVDIDHLKIDDQTDVNQNKNSTLNEDLDKKIKNDSIEIDQNNNKSLDNQINNDSLKDSETKIKSENNDTFSENNKSISENNNTDNNNVLFIKNVSFESTEQDLKELFLKCDPNLKSIKLIINKTFKNNSHLGYGFVECSSTACATRVISKCNLAEIHSHKIQISYSKMSDNTTDLKRKRTDVEKHTPQSDEMQTSRLIVKNLPFQCNKNELKSLLDKIVNTKQIRIPKKKDNTSRGFG